MDSIDQLGDEIGELAARLDSATHRLLACIRAFDEAGGWERQGAVSCAHWLAWRIGLDQATARERVRVARALGRLPRIDEALSRGQLSYAKARALTRIATPDLEAALLELARYATGAQLERICRGYRQVRDMGLDGLGLSEIVAEDRCVRERLLPGGMVKVELVLCPDEAAVFLQASEAGRAELLRDRPPGRAGNDAALPSPADGAMRMAETSLAAAPSDAGDTTGATSTDRHQVVIHVDEDVILRGERWAATLDDGTRVSAEALRRLTCDAGLVPVLSREAAVHPGHRHDSNDSNEAATPGATLDIGRKTRSIPTAIRRALWRRDRGCQFPGCRHTRYLHGHHIRHWLHGGATSAENLVLLCSHHHRLVHEGGFAVERVAPGALLFRAPTGMALPAIPTSRPIADSAEAVEALAIWARDRDIAIEPATNLPWWDGAVPDYDAAVTSLLSVGSPALR